MFLELICPLCVLTAYLLWRRTTRWAGLLLASFLSAGASALSLLAWALTGLTDGFSADGSPYVPESQQAVGTGFGIACALLALLALILFICGIKAAIVAWRAHHPL